jgi:hypothetical protein
MPSPLKSLVLFPLHATERVGRAVLHPLLKTAELALEATGLRGGGDAAEVPQQRPAARPSRPRSAPRPAASERAPFPATAERQPAAPPEPEHVSEEPVLVSESADPGAEEGVGAALHVDEPWEGYRSMKAADVIGRIEGATREEIAVVQLFETMNRRRSSVLAAAERELKAASAPGSRRS